MHSAFAVQCVSLIKWDHNNRKSINLYAFRPGRGHQLLCRHKSATNDARVRFVRCAEHNARKNKNRDNAYKYICLAIRLRMANGLLSTRIVCSWHLLPLNYTGCLWFSVRVWSQLPAKPFAAIALLLPNRARFFRCPMPSLPNIVAVSFHLHRWSGIGPIQFTVANTSIMCVAANLTSTRPFLWNKPGGERLNLRVSLHTRCALTSSINYTYFDMLMPVCCVGSFIQSSNLFLFHVLCCRWLSLLWLAWHWSERRSSANRNSKLFLKRALGKFYGVFFMNCMHN